MIKISMTETSPSPYPNGKGASKGCFGYLDIGLLGFVWNLGFDDWYFN